MHLIASCERWMWDETELEHRGRQCKVPSASQQQEEKGSSCLTCLPEHPNLLEQPKPS